MTAEEILKIIDTSGLSDVGKRLVVELSYCVSPADSSVWPVNITDIIPYAPLKNGKPNVKFVRNLEMFLSKFIWYCKSSKPGFSKWFNPFEGLDSKDIKKCIDVAKKIAPYLSKRDIFEGMYDLEQQGKLFDADATYTPAMYYYIRDCYKRALEFKKIKTQEILANTATNIVNKTEDAKKIVESVNTTVKAAVQNVSQAPRFAIDLTKKPSDFHSMVTKQATLFKKCVEATPAAKSVSEVKKVADNLKSVADLGKEVKAAKDAVEKGTEAAKGVSQVSEKAKVAEKAVEQGANVVKKATQETVKAIASGKTKIITSVVVAVVALVSAPLITGWREKASIAKVKELTENALNSKNYQDLAKYIGLLKKMQAKNTFMDKLMVADAASKLAEGNLADIKKGYTICGATMIAASVVLCLLVGVASNVIGTLKEMISNPSFNSILGAIGKLAVLGILLAPALVGICLIKVAQDGFNEEGPAAYIVSLLTPVISLCNYCIKGVMELIANAEANKMNNNSSDKDKYISTLKSMKYQLDKMLANEKIS
jgi:hypothetical protein